MPISECCNIGVVSCNADTTLPAAAALMRKHHVGAVVVVEDRGGLRVPVGIITDRDIVIETVALDVDADVFTAGDLMSAPIVTVNEESGFVETLRVMRSHKVRRLPVLKMDGSLFGIVTADDIVRLLAVELSMLTDAMTEQPIREGRLRR